MSNIDIPRIDGVAREHCDASRRIDAGSYLLAILFFIAVTLRRLLWLRSSNFDFPGIAFDFASTAIAAIGMTALLTPILRGNVTRLHTVLACGLLGLTFFVATLGFALANPAHIGWLLHNDWAQHFIGWHLYRSAPWRWPPGVFDTFWYPVGTAIVYTDSLPLVSMPLKLISSLLPVRFQYIGLWLLLNCILQGVFGGLLLRCVSRSLAVQTIGAGLFLLAPIFLNRIGHDTLTTQWLILAGFWLYFRHSETPARDVYAWLVLTAVSALVHPYLNAMVLAVAFAYYLRAGYVDDDGADRHSAIIQYAGLLGASVLCWWLSGVFSLSPSGGGVSLGIYNANLLTWFDPQFMSRWLPTLPSGGPGQYEGANYLGLGVLLLVATAIPLLLLTPSRNGNSRPAWPLVVVASLLALYAFGTRFTIGSIQLVDLTPAHISVFGVFRSSGRFLWVSTYLIMLAVIAVVAQRAGRFAPVLLGGAFILQVVDLSPLHGRSMHLRQEVDLADGHIGLSDPRWKELASNVRHITLVPPPACGIEAAPYLPFSLLAGDNRLTLNTGYLARFDEARTFAYCDQLRAELDSGKRDRATLYIVSPEQLERFRNSSSEPLNCNIMDNYTYCKIEVAPTQE